MQSSVGQWGDAEDPSNNYDGGHIIGAQLGGWGGRLNLVPWDNQFNGGNWALIENQVQYSNPNSNPGRSRNAVRFGNSLRKCPWVPRSV